MGLLYIYEYNRQIGKMASLYSKHTSSHYVIHGE